MMTSEERIAALHEKMNNLRQKRERQKTFALGAASAALSLCLLFLIFGAGSAQPGGTAGLYSGATMLFANAGGYVLVAIAAFMAGVAITVVLRNREKRRRDKGACIPENDIKSHVKNGC